MAEKTTKQGFWTIQTKILFPLLLLGLASLGALSAVQTYYLFQNNRAETKEKLQGVNAIKSAKLRREFRNLRRMLVSHSQEATLHDVILDLSSARKELTNSVKALVPSEEMLWRRGNFMREVRAQNIDYFRKVVENAIYSVGVMETVPKPETFRDPFTELIWNAYIVRNPEDLAEKTFADSTDDIVNNEHLLPEVRALFSQSSFSRSYDKYDPFLTDRADVLDHDFYVLDKEGYILYTSNKHMDMGTNILNGLTKGTPLAEVAQQAIRMKRVPDVTYPPVFTSDFANYYAEFGTPSAFMAVPVQNGQDGSVIGAYVVRISTREIQDIVSLANDFGALGLGDTGESYIIGSDYFKRSDSRDLVNIKSSLKRKYFQSDGRTFFESSINVSKVDTLAAKVLFEEGQEQGFGIYTNYAGKEVVGAYSLIHLPGLDYGLMTEITTAEVDAPFWESIQLNLMISSGVLGLFSVFSVTLAGNIASPVRRLAATAEKVSQGDTVIRSDVQTGDEVGALAVQFNSMLDELDSQSDQMRRILGTVNEGLFLIGEDLKIFPQYSRYTEIVLDRKELAGISFRDYLRPLINDKTLTMTNDYLEILFDPTVKEKLIQSLNPLDEVQVNFDRGQGKIDVRYLEFRFNRLVDAEKVEQVMVTVSDITARVELARQIKEAEAQSENQMELLMGIMHVDPALLVDFMDGAQGELSEIDKLLKGEALSSIQVTRTPEEREIRYRGLCQQIFRRVHLIKGNASLLQLKFFEARAHDFEDRIAALDRKRENLSGDDFLPVTINLSDFQDDFEMMRDLIERLGSMRQSMASGTEKSGAAASIVNQLDRFIVELGAEQGKRVEFRSENFASLTLPFEKRKAVSDVLAQLTRNSVIHGIEGPNRRKENGKAETGIISLVAEEIPENGHAARVQLKLRDDGRGLQLDKIREQAIAMGIMDSKKAEFLSKDDAYGLIFKTGFSTSETATKDAGRGVGLDAVKERLNQINGTIAVDSEPGQFCEFTIELSME